MNTLRAEDTFYWHCLTPKERKGRKGREFKSFYKAWTKALAEPIKHLVYTGSKR